MTHWAESMADLNIACRDEFGIPAVYLPSATNHPDLAGKSFAIIGVVSDNRETGNLLGVRTVEQTVAFKIIQSDLGFDPMENDEIAIDSIIYRVLEIQTFRYGEIHMMLNHTLTG